MLSEFFEILRCSSRSPTLKSLALRNLNAFLTLNNFCNNTSFYSQHIDNLLHSDKDPKLRQFRTLSASLSVWNVCECRMIERFFQNNSPISWSKFKLRLFHSRLALTHTTNSLWKYFFRESNFMRSYTIIWDTLINN